MTIADKTFTAPWDIFPQAAAGQELGHAANRWDLYGRNINVSGTVQFGANVVTFPAAGTVPVGTGANTQVAYWTGVNTLAGNAGLTYTAATGSLLVTSLNAAASPLIVQGAAAQTASLQAWLNSVGFIHASISFQGETLIRAGSVAVGGTRQLTVSRVLTSSTAGNVLVEFDNLLNNTGADANDSTAFLALTQIQTAQAYNNTYYGFRCQSTVSINATVAGLVGYESRVGDAGGAFPSTIVNMSGSRIWMFVNAATITWSRAIEISTPFMAGGTLTNSIGIQIDNHNVATNNWAILTNAGNIVFNEGGDAGTDFRVESNNRTHMLFVDGGLDAVGVNTSAPDRLLHAEVSDAVTNAVTYALRLGHITSGAAAAGFATGIEFELEDGGGGFDVLAAIQVIETDATAGAEHGELAFFTADIGDDGLAERVRIDKDGYVGIGTVNPATKLDVDGNIQIFDTDAANGTEFGYLNFHSTAGGSTGNHARIGAIRDSNAAGQLVFYTKQGGALHERVRIDSGGNVGIGTTSPDRLLHVEVSDAVTNAVTYAQRLSHITSGAAAAGFATGVEFELEDDGGGFDVLAAIQTIETDATAGAEHGELAFFTADIGDDGLAERVRVDHDGRVGVMIATPAAQMHVDQSVVDAAIPVLYLDQADVDQEMIEFATTIGVGNAIEAVGGKTLTVTHFIKCTIPGPLTRYMPCGTIA